MPSLLETARKIPVRRQEKKRTACDMDLAIKWLKRESPTCQVCKAMMKGSSAQAFVWLAITLRAAYKAGKITVA